MKLRSWLALRSPEYLIRKARTLARRYGISASKAVERTTSFISYLAERGGGATLFAPARVLERNPHAIAGFRDAGIEIGMHGWEHVDLRNYPVEDARAQLIKAMQAFGERGMDVRGFRCPYLSHSDALIASLPEDLLEYSSNVAVWWDVIDSSDLGKGNAVYDATLSFYSPNGSDTHLSIPWQRAHLTEIPVSLPDDMLLFDGIYRNVGAMARAWQGILTQTYQRGELFNLIFHPELADLEQEPFGELLAEAKRLNPPIWSTTLRDISTWWREKQRCRVVVSSNGATPDGTAGEDGKQAAQNLHIRFGGCSPRTTVLFRDGGPRQVLPVAGTEPWDGPYRRLTWRSGRDAPGSAGDGASPGEWSVAVPARPRPFVGVTQHVPAETVTLLRDLGYIVETGAEAQRCGVIIDERTLQEHTSAVALVAHIETTTAPLIRFWPWPDGARSALCFSGDLDALSLADYAGRLFVR